MGDVGERGRDGERSTYLYMNISLDRDTSLSIYLYIEIFWKVGQEDRVWG